MFFLSFSSYRLKVLYAQLLVMAYSECSMTESRPKIGSELALGFRRRLASGKERCAFQSSSRGWQLMSLESVCHLWVSTWMTIIDQSIHQYLPINRVIWAGAQGNQLGFESCEPCSAQGMRPLQVGTKAVVSVKVSSGGMAFLWLCLKLIFVWLAR